MRWTDFRHWLVTGVSPGLRVELAPDAAAMATFHAEQRRTGVKHARRLTGVLLTFNLLFWLTDASVFARVAGVQPALSEGRLTVSVLAVLILVTSRVRGVALFIWGWAAGLAICAVVGWTMGRIGGPSSAWFHYAYPFLSLPLIAWMCPLHRMAVSTAFFGSVTLSYFGPHPAHLADPMMWSAVSNLAYTALLNTLIGLYLDQFRLRLFLLNRSRLDTLDQLSERVRAQTRHIQALLDHTEAAREAERRALAAELHDEIGQVLTGLRLMVKAARERTDRATARPELEQIALMLQHGTRSLRGVLSRLRPQILDDMGLRAAIESLVETHQRHVPIELTLGSDFRALPDAVETVAYRVAQESLTNVVRHADAGVVRLEIGIEGGVLRAHVQDDGVGFDPTQIEASRLGVLGMRERARAVGGGLTIETAPGEGTTVRLEVPLS